MKLEVDTPLYKGNIVIIEVQIKYNENGLEDMGRGKGKMGQSERVAWTYIHYQT